jgi:hypothetical protein
VGVTGLFFNSTSAPHPSPAAPAVKGSGKLSTNPINKITAAFLFLISKGGLHLNKIDTEQLHFFF